MTESTLSTVDSIAARMKQVLLAETCEKRRFPLLEALTGIPQATWRSWWNHGVVPSGALVEAVAKQWPHYAFWLATRLPDFDCGHVMPAGIKELVIEGISKRGNAKEIESFSKELFKVHSEIRANFHENETNIPFEICINSENFLRHARLQEITKPL